MKRSIIVWLIAMSFIILFLYTGVSKLLEYDVAKEQIALTPLLAPIAGGIVIALPILEILVSIILFFSRTRKYGLYASLVLMCLFTGYVINILSYNDQLPCTCGGVLEEMTWPQHLIFNGSMIVLSVLALYLSRVARPNSIKDRTSFANA